MAAERALVYPPTRTVRWDLRPFAAGVGRGTVEAGSVVRKALVMPSYRSSSAAPAHVAEGIAPSGVPDTHVMVLPDGRDLAWMELGAPDGAPVMVFHGTPGSRLQLVVGDAPSLAQGVRLIVPDRPGYGLSGHQRRRSLRSWAEDVRRLADHLGLARFAVAGLSGGGPHAVACAWFLADRVWAAAIISGVAPLTEQGSEAGMVPADVALVRLARRSPVLSLPLFAAMAALDRRWSERMLTMMERELGPADAAVLRRPEVRAAFLSDLKASSRTTGVALAQDYALFAHDWGFRLEDITVPVHLWHGDADRDVPIAQGRRQAEAIPDAVLHECPGEGHLLGVERLEEILRVVVDLR
ncbi:MAG: alpha/beta fold hydrolase [Nocardioidaceae bacterium]